MKTVSILGCGWLGIALAQRLIMDGFSVKGSTTTPSRMNALAALGIKPSLISLDRTRELDSFFSADSVVISVPPKLRIQSGQHYLHQMRVAAEALSNVCDVIFISSTSVYPDINRSVTEDDADLNSILVQAENLFTEEKGRSAAVIRFAGLVGPGRHPGRFLSGKDVRGGNNPVNLIHLEDCIRIIRILIDAGRPLVINACADAHPTKREFYTHAAKLLNVPPPVFSDDDTPGFKVVSNERLKNELGYRFTFPDPMLMTY